MELENIVESVALIIVVLSIFVKKFIEWYKLFKSSNKNKMEDNTKKMEKIYEKLIECRLTFGACRVSINQFHNGEYFFSEDSIVKMSMTHETTDESTAKISINYQSVLASMYPKFIKLIYSEDVVVYKNIGNIDNSDDDMVLDLKMNGTEEFYVVKLTNSKGHLIGFLGISFCDTQIKPVDLKKVKDFGNLISFILRN